jgi:hypothetical protein
MHRLSLLLGLFLLAPGCGQEDPTPETPAATDTAAAESESSSPPVTAPPGTDIWLASVERTPGGELRLGEPRNLTLRPDAYDNQPHFTPSGDGILYTAGDAGGRTDIHRLDPGTGDHRPVTRTPEESEYSPTPLPDGGFAVIRVEPDGTQRLWRFEADGRLPRILLPDVAPVGYQAWLDEDRVALFVLGDPPSLQVARRSTGEVERIFDGIGPSLHPIPGEDAVSFVEVAGEESWIRRYDGRTGDTRRIVQTVDGASHHAWTPDGVLLMASGRRILALSPGTGEWADLGPLGPEGIQWSRLAVHPNGGSLALVGEEADPQ